MSAFRKGQRVQLKRIITDKPFVALMNLVGSCGDIVKVDGVERRIINGREEYVTPYRVHFDGYTHEHPLCFWEDELEDEDIPL